jgi:hypothetical protein
VRDPLSMSFSAILLTCWTGVDDRTIQGSDSFIPVPDHPDSSDFDESSFVSSDETRSLRGSRSEHSDKEIAKDTEDPIVSEPTEIPGRVSQKEWPSSLSSKKKSKKSKLTATWAFSKE